MSNLFSGGIWDVGIVVICCLSINFDLWTDWGVGFSVRCCLSVNLMIVGIRGVSFVVRCCFSVKIDEWRDLGC